MISEKLQVSLYNPATAQYGKYEKSKPNSHESY
jgi:hypothetical protein